MNEYNIILVFAFAPEVMFVLCLPFKDARGWWFRMIEDSDGDPHHTDGLFIVLLFAALWCFRIGIISGLQHIYYDKQLLNLAITFLTSGSTLIGVRIVLKNKTKSSTSNDNETKYE